MRYPEYLRLEGAGSVALGLVYAIVAFPGLVVSYRAWWLALLIPVVVMAALGTWAARRRGARFDRPGTWLTERPLERAKREGRLAASAVIQRRRLVLETAAWTLGGLVWVLAVGSSALLFFGTGLASIAFGAVQAVLAHGRVVEAERRSGVRYWVARRARGAPQLLEREGRSVAREPARVRAPVGTDGGDEGPEAR